jgi:hypothetical protein
MKKNRRLYVGSLQMERACWRLLYMYGYLLKRRALQQGLGVRVTMARTIGAILSRFLLAHRERIIEEYKTLRAVELARLGGLPDNHPAFQSLLSDLPGFSPRRPDPSDPVHPGPGAL